uniref:Reverse transcriptase domain-containing protein n=1 Tax=Tanacetum cinerariifolium TaxID=118510 RepID=A0A6L2MZG3_TANCI|nr:reverse transcriptase domain-containing protein [Tanacetum cinerariifolium]
MNPCGLPTVVASNLGSAITIPETTNGFAIKADLDASINLMTYSLYEKLSLEALKPTKMSVRLPDQSFQHLIGIAENMLVEVGKFTFPVDFVILEMEEDSKVPLILGRPFLHTVDAAIQVKQKQLNLGVGTERVTFSINFAMKHSYSNDDTCFSIDVIDKILKEDFDALLDKGKNSEFESDTEEPPFENIIFNTDYKIKTSLKEPPSDLELKPLPDHLEYVLLEEPTFLPVIISSQLSEQNKIGSVLGHKDGKHFHPIYFAIKTLNAAQQKYTVNKKELIDVVFTFDKFRPYLILSKTIVYTDYSALKNLFKKQDAKPRLIRWIMILQEFDIEIKDKKGTKHVAADYLSRIDNDEASDDNDVDVVLMAWMGRNADIKDDVSVKRAGAYDFFAPALLPGYAGNPNNNNGRLEADDYLLGELKAMVDEQMVVPAIDEVAEPVAKAEEEQVIAPAVDMKEGQMDFPMIDMEEDLATLFDDDDFEDDASDGFSEEEVNDAEVAASVTIGELGPRIYAVEGQVQVMASQMVYAADRWEQVGAQVEQGQQTAAQRGVTVAELTQHVQALQIDVKNHAMSDKSSPLKRLVIEINVWVKLPGGENIFTLLQILMQVNILLLTAWRESHASHYGRVVLKGKYLRFLRWVEAEMISPEVESEKWRRPLLRWMYVAFDVSTDGREEEFFPRNEIEANDFVPSKWRHPSLFWNDNRSNQRFGLREKFDGRLKIKDLAKSRGLIEAWWFVEGVLYDENGCFDALSGAKSLTMVVKLKILTET